MVFLELAKGDKVFALWGVTKQFLWLALGGIFVGIVCFTGVLAVLRRTRSYQIGLFTVLVGAYGSFFFADHHHIEVSAVLAVVVFGFAMSAVG